MDKPFLPPNSLARAPYWWIAMLLASLALCACGAQPESAPSLEANVGEIALNLTLGGSITIDSATYTIVGPHAFVKTGTLNVASSNQLSALIGGIPADTGFTLTLSASAAGGTVTCTGSAPFAVSAGQTTNVQLPVQCRVPSDNGGIVIDGGVNICPVIDELSANPNEVPVGASLHLTASAHDTDSGPSPLDYHWSTSSGTLQATGSSATLTCTAAGDATVTLVVTDGAPDCIDSTQVQVKCSGGGSTVPQPAPVPPAFVALLATGLLQMGMRRVKGRSTG